MCKQGQECEAHGNYHKATAGKLCNTISSHFTLRIKVIWDAERDYFCWCWKRLVHGRQIKLIEHR